MTEPLFPLFLRLHGRDVLVVGAGAIAERKVTELLDGGARVRVVAPRATDALLELARVGRIVFAHRPFEERDLEGQWLVVAATDDAATQQRIHDAAEARRTFLIAIDDPSRGSAFSGAVLRKPPFLVAISSSGEAPALSRLLKEVLEDALPEASWVEHARALRERWQREGVPIQERFGDLVRAFKDRT